MSGEKPDCKKCGFVLVIPENYELMEIMNIYQNFFIDGMGGMSAVGISNVLDWENKQGNKALLQKIIMYISYILIRRSEDR